VSHHLAARRRALTLRGRNITLRRITGTAPTFAFTDVALLGSTHEYMPHELVGGLIQGDLRVEILDDEIAEAGWPGPPMKGDKVQIDGRSRTVQGCQTHRDGETIVGHTLWTRG
jgi:hypothetical protein